MRLEENKFNFTKHLIEEKLNQVSNEWNEACKNNRGENLKHKLKCKYFDLADVNTKLASMRLRHF